MALIGIDFDGTCVAHEFPKVGKDIGAVPVLKQLVAKGHKLILWTVRANNYNPSTVEDDPSLAVMEGGRYLDNAVAWFVENDIPLYAVNKNPTQRSWSKSPKVFVHHYIDDLAIGTPLRKEGWVDWDAMAQLLRIARLI